MIDTKPNAELAYRVLDHIDAHPEMWEQGRWVGSSDCGTTACFAGWVVLLSGMHVDEGDSIVTEGPALMVGLDVPTAADKLLRISADTIPVDPYDGLLTREELGECVLDIFGPRPVVAA